MGQRATFEGAGGSIVSWVESFGPTPPRSLAGRLWAGVGLTLAIGTVVLASARYVRADEVDYEPVIKIHEIKAVDKDEKSRRKTIQLLFDVHPKVPKGAKIELELEYLGTTLVNTTYEVKSDIRTKQKFTWDPNIRLPVDSYILMSRMKPEAQPRSVKKALESVTDVFPPDSQPWTWYHADKKLEIGSPEDLAAEEAEIRETYKKWCFALLDMNGEFVDAMDEVIEGKKFVSDGKLEEDELKDWVEKWMKKMAEFQMALQEYPDKEPGVYRKTQRLHYETTELSRMVGKRCYRDKLQETLEKYGKSVGELKLPAVKGFDPNYRYAVSPKFMQARYETIARIAKFDDGSQ